MKYLITVIILSFSISTSHAASVLITFDPPTLPGGQRLETNYTESGMDFTGSFTSTDSGSSSLFPDNGTGYLQLLGGSSLTFGMSDSSVFSLISIDLAEYSTLFASPKTVTFTGYKPDASTVTANFTTDGIIDGTGSLVDFETFTFGSNFQGLAFVTTTSIPFSMDNLLVQPIPIPAAVWLFASGLMGLAGIARARR